MGKCCPANGGGLKWAADLAVGVIVDGSHPLTIVTDQAPALLAQSYRAGLGVK